MGNKVISYSLFTDFDINLFKSGKHFKLYEKMGAHPITYEGEEGCYFSVWAPSADKVAVIGDFNGWSGENHLLNVRWDSSGIWEGFLPGVKLGERYKFKIWSNHNNQILEKADPYARSAEHPPMTASVVSSDKYKWNDAKWMKSRNKKNSLDAPYSVYEVHLGSWKKVVDENRPLSYQELATELVSYVKDMGYTHVELLPIMEHPYEPSWGYQVTSFYAPSIRHGRPEEFKVLVDAFHNAGVGVILDWVPAHFPSDAWALANFDGTHLYEHPDPRKGYHPDWKSLIFNFDRNEVRSFLISSALFWLDEFHIDGLRVDAVASMLYLDYSRNDGEWEPNEYGGNENLSAISFLKDFNQAVYSAFPDVQTIAEESTSFSMISRPVDMGGLGFGMKWMMGWMNDTLDYFAKDPVYRSYHHNKITFSLAYAFTENFMLPLSHDEVVHGKGSMIRKMPGDEWQRFANLRLLYAYMMSHPGSKLFFMGNDIAQYNEWNHATGLDWNLLDFPYHRGINNLIKDLNKLYKKEPALYNYAYQQEGFEWIDHTDYKNSVIVFLRKSEKEKDTLLVICNFTPNPIEKYTIGVPASKSWKLIFNTDDLKYEGSGYTTSKTIRTRKKESHGRESSMTLKVVPLGVCIYKLSKA